MTQTKVNEELKKDDFSFRMSSESSAREISPVFKVVKNSYESPLKGK